jgi:hypothetical protein
MGQVGFDLFSEVSIFTGAVCEASEAHLLSPVFTPLECLCEPSYPTRMPWGSPDTVSWQLQANPLIARILGGLSATGSWHLDDEPAITDRWIFSGMPVIWARSHQQSTTHQPKG